ncbi:MAG: lipopolysaccharide N-acetylglucosaminyltransferase [Planctomycetota bacterium]|nr:MAG: lipopolysaccharide N-acetylglucosaminyltransferase [Planctomycetota bacterium]
MKICLVHNSYGAYSGEEAVVAGQEQMLLEAGHKVVSFTKTSEGLNQSAMKKIDAFFSGIYSRKSKREFEQFLKVEKPDVINIHNLYPLISPSILSVGYEAGIPIVMTVHNVRLICPNGLFFTHGEICEKCSEGKEYWCVLKNCEQNLMKSTGYALRAAFARITKMYQKYVTLYTCLTRFQRNKLISAGYPKEKMVILSNFSRQPEVDVEYNGGEYIGFVGRISPEKGIPNILRAAQKIPDIPFKFAGNYERMKKLIEKAPPNAEFVGPLGQDELDVFYANIRILVLASECYESFPLVLTEAMYRKIPVISSWYGGLSDIVIDGSTGLLVKPQSSKDLATQIKYLWEKPDLCKKFGEEGYQRAMKKYTPAVYIKYLMLIYERAITERNSKL